MRTAGVLYVLGWLIAVLAVAMLLPALTAFARGDPETASIFFLSATLTFFFGGAMSMGLRGTARDIDKAGSLLLVAATWVVLPIFAAVPIYFSGVVPGATDAYFEAVSGFTTTGATVLTNLAEQSPAILLWRALLQWLGGLVTIIAAVGILVANRIGGLELHRAVLPHGEGRTLLGRLRQTGRALGGVYVMLTVICVIGLWLGGLPGFDALCHALSTVSTGGFSTRDNSIGAFNAPVAEFVAVLFMIAGALNMSLHWAAINGRWRSYLTDPEARYLLGAGLFVTVVVAAAIIWEADMPDGMVPGTIGSALQTAVVNGVSMLTTTGFTSGDTTGLPLLPALLLMSAMLVGGSTGSTSGGIKLMRVAVLVKHAGRELDRLSHPHGVKSVRYAAHSVDYSEMHPVWAAFVLFAFTLGMLSVLLTLSGEDIRSAMAAAAAALTNTGPAIGMISGEEASYARFGAAAKWLIIWGMLAGRAELLVLLTLVNPAYWRG